MGALLLLCDCSPQPASPGTEIEVAHSWTSGGEAEAVRTLARAYADRGGQWRDFSVAGFQNALALVLSRLAGGTPPGAVQFMGGAPSADLARHGLLLPLDALAARNHWRERLPASLYLALGDGVHIYQAPVNLHVNNWLYISRKTRVAAGIDAVPQDWDSFFTMLDRLREKGVIPLAVGGQVWQEQILFDFVLLSRGGPKLYQRIYRDRDGAAVRSPAFRDVAETFGRLRAYADPGSPGRNWNDAADMVIAGKAGVFIMGDWGESEFRRAKLTPGRDYDCQIGLGRSDPIVSSDVFVFPKSKAVQPARQMALAAVVTDPVVQRRFSDKLGSLPAFGGPGPAPVGCAAVAAAALALPGNGVPYMTMILPPDVQGDLSDVVGDFWSANDTSTSQFIERFAITLETST